MKPIQKYYSVVDSYNFNLSNNTYTGLGSIGRLIEIANGLFSPEIYSEGPQLLTSKPST